MHWNAATVFATCLVSSGSTSPGWAIWQPAKASSSPAASLPSCDEPFNRRQVILVGSEVGRDAYRRSSGNFNGNGNIGNFNGNGNSGNFNGNGNSGNGKGNGYRSNGNGNGPGWTIRAPRRADE
ncbi:hypothetical protein [Methylobacterium sp. J-070]|uniref:hypothetical protein n=1 Tax=Methylobacterium sp. J-070 TaxID=2836650 RepID=UPI001FBA6CD1|nr:hypothetical protein [Methylobacterium sp. J-070]MCJ2049188.1 hypothetical protein [Methylobacterium sp. J-070]